LRHVVWVYITCILIIYGVATANAQQHSENGTQGNAQLTILPNLAIIDMQGVMAFSSSSSSMAQDKTQSQPSRLTSLSISLVSSGVSPTGSSLPCAVSEVMASWMSVIIHLQQQQQQPHSIRFISGVSPTGSSLPRPVSEVMASWMSVIVHPKHCVLKPHTVSLFS
jgi:hypothetical protein